MNDCIGAAGLIFGHKFVSRRVNTGQKEGILLVCERCGEFL